MKITICCKQFGARGGAETFLRGFTRCLVSGGHSVTVLAAQGKADLDGVAFARLAVPRVPHAFHDLALARAARRALAGCSGVTFSDQKCWGAQVVRCGGGAQREYVRQRPKSYRNGLSRAANRVRWALSIREWLRIYIDDRLYAPPGPRCVIANSDMVRRHLVRHYPHLAGRIRVVYNGADPGRFHPGLRDDHRRRVRGELGIPEAALVGVFVGHDWRRKGLYTFIESLGILAAKPAARPVYGIVVGRGKRRRAERFARRCGARQVLRVAGAADPAPCYGAADLLVLPSYFDPCANVTMEGLACGLPAITSVHNGAFELLDPGSSGFYVQDPSESAQLAGFIEHYLDDERLATGRQAVLTLAAGYTLDGQCRRIVEAIESLATPE